MESTRIPPKSRDLLWPARCHGRPTLTAVVVLLLALPAMVEAAVRPPGRAGGVPQPAVFESHGSALGVTAENGFDVSVVNGRWRHRGHAHLGATGRISSPWGEEMKLRFWFNPDGSVGVEFGGRATMHYEFDELGALRDVTAVTDAGVRRTFAGDRAQRVVLGKADLWELDYAPYEALFAQITAGHSEDFLAGVAALGRKLDRSGGFAPAGCTGDILQCTGAILVWIASVPTIAAACTAGSTLTLGAACLGAILAHEGAGAVAVGACVNAIQNCMDRHSHTDDPGGGCNGPGDGPE